MEFWAYSDHYPIFLDPNMRNLLRVNLYRGINFLNNPMSRCNNFIFSGCTNKSTGLMKICLEISKPYLTTKSTSIYLLNMIFLPQ